MSEFPLGQPGQLGPLRLRNRCVIPAHSMRLGYAGGGVPVELHAFAIERARGGAALLGLESAPVQRATSVELSPLPLHDDVIIPSLRNLADDVRASGGALSLVLWHGGHHVPSRVGIAPVAASAIPSCVTGDVPRALRRGEIPELLASYGAAARRCRLAGLGAVEVQTSSDYLLGSFLSPRLNRRNDEYGGHLANRVRLVAEVLTAVREAAGPGLAVGVRTSVAHLIPGDDDDYAIDESLAAMQYLADRGLIDYVSLLQGSHWSMDEIIPPLGAPRIQLEDAGRRFRAALGLPVIVTGRIRTVAEGTHLLETGAADFVGMVRPWIADPHWFIKAVAGKADQIRPCISCNQGCLGFVARGFPGTCVLNARAGRETQLPDIEPAASPDDFDVIGGGPAGLEVARVLAERGHRVTLFEACLELGGQMRWAASAPHREELRLALEWWERELRRLRVKITLGTTVPLGYARVRGQTIWAIGAHGSATSIWRWRPFLIAGIPGTGLLPHSRDVWSGHVRPQGNVAVIDEEGGWAAFSLAEYLAACSEVHSLTVVTAELLLGESDLQYTFEMRVARPRLLQQPHVKLIEGCLVREVSDQVILLTDGRQIGPFDAIILSTGTSAPELPTGALAIGDCVAPRSWWAAVNDAYRLAVKV